jgi:hypothetical protein
VDLYFVSSPAIQIKLPLALTVSRSQHSLFSYSKSVTYKIVSRINLLIILDKSSIFYFFIFVLGVHCGIYRSSDNVSNMSYVMHPLHHSPLSPSSYFWNTFKSSHFSIYIYVYTVFAPYSPSYTLSPHLPLSHWYQSPRQDMFCPPALRFCKTNDIFVCLR